jgi:hypothetical protein
VYTEDADIERATGRGFEVRDAERGGADSASAYKLAEDIRVQRLSAQLKQSALKPRALTDLCTRRMPI